MLSLLLATAGCVSLPGSPVPLPAHTPVVSPESFFTGRTEGVGTIALLAHRRQPFRVVGIGHTEADGTLVLAQRVERSGAPPKQREWRIRQVAPGRFAGTLSDAVGPVAGTVDGDLLRLRFRMAGGLAAEQDLTLQPDGRTILNRMTVRKWGVVVARLAETIRKID